MLGALGVTWGILGVPIHMRSLWKQPIFIPESTTNACSDQTRCTQTTRKCHDFCPENHGKNDRTLVHVVPETYMKEIRPQIKKRLHLTELGTRR